MVALTGIERVTSLSSSVQLGLTQSFYVWLVRRRRRKQRCGRLASSLGRHLRAGSPLKFCLACMHRGVERRGRGYTNLRYLLLKAQRLAALKTEFLVLPKAA